MLLDHIETAHINPPPKYIPRAQDINDLFKNHSDLRQFPLMPHCPCCYYSSQYDPLENTMEMSDRLKEQEAKAEELSKAADAARSEFYRMATEEGWTEYDLRLRTVSRINWVSDERRELEINKFKEKCEQKQSKFPAPGNSV